MAGSEWLPYRSPYIRGKSKLIFDFMLEGWSNEKIYRYIENNKLDGRYVHPVIMENIYMVRT